YAPKSLERRSAQTVLWELLLSLNKILAPIISFTAEEVWQYVRKIDSSVKESIHLEIMPVVNEKFIDKNLEETYEKLLEIRDDVLKAIEEARKQDLVRHPYEARVILKLPKEYKEIVEKRLDWIKFFFTVSQVELSDNPEGDVVINGESVKDSVVAISKAKGEKCPRCWIYDESVGRNGQPVCDRCKTQLEIMNIKLEELA
ncbi:MAG: class I tRNA ligase family protein, partial [Sulfurihydrogenibium sp.]|nr:class I tRNA ligase family protein [Sulfurihydrogenibium sp.]